MKGNDLKLQWEWAVDSISMKKIGKRHLICWGCGEYIHQYAIEMNLSDMIIIDGDTKKHGNSIMLNNREYTIYSSNILKQLDITKYYIVITAVKEWVVAEIERILQEDYPEWKEQYCMSSQLYRIYPDILSALVCDPYVHKKIDANRIAVNLPEYISKANDILTNNIKGAKVKGYTVVRNSSRVILIVMCEDNKYYLHFPCLTNYYNYFYENVIKENFEVRQRLGVNKEIVLYESDDGFMLSRFIQTSFNEYSNDEFIVSVMKKLREVHKCGKQVNINNNIHKIIIDLERKLEIDESSLGGCVAFINKLVLPETKEYEKCLIHGDFHLGNILHQDGKIEIIDWIAMSMGDPIYDVCFLYYFVNMQCERSFNGILNMYYGHNPNEKEYRHALAWLIVITYWKYLEELQKHGSQKEMILGELKQRMDEYEKII